MRLKDFVTGSIISNNTIQTCGVYDYQLGEGEKNGEGIYIGTSSNQVPLDTFYDMWLPYIHIRKSFIVMSTLTFSWRGISRWRKLSIEMQYFSTRERTSSRC